MLKCMSKSSYIFTFVSFGDNFVRVDFPGYVDSKSKISLRIEVTSIPFI